MTTRDRAPIGDPCWVDHMTRDPGRLRSFYTGLFGWEAGEASEEFGGYFMFLRDGVPVAGAMPAIDDHTPAVWTTYLAVEDAWVTLDRAAAADAQVIAPAMRVGDLGTMGVMIDPSGAAIGVWAPIGFQGFGVVAEVNAPVWFELHSRAYDDSVKFYQEIFGWVTSVMSDTDDFKYTTANHGAEQYAGLMDADAMLPEGVPSFWNVYFGVADVDAAVAKVRELGGAVRMEAQDTPYGRMAAVADPDGAVFSVIKI
jgi:predicted enzyme related to lactoylglutathione lyase